MKIKIKKFLVLIIFLANIFSGFSFSADLPATCNDTQAQLKSLIDNFGTYLGNIKSSGATTKSSFIATDSFGIGDWLKLSYAISKKSDLNSSFLSNAYQGAAIINFVGPLESDISSLFGSIKLLENEKIAKREWQKVLDMENKNWDIGSDLSKKQVLYNQLSQSQLNSLNNNFVFKGGSSPLNLEVKFLPGTTFLDLINFNQKYIYFLKMLILYSTTNTQDNYDFSKYLEGLDYEYPTISITKNPNDGSYISSQALVNIKKDYQGSTGLTNQCSDQLKQTFANMKSIVDMAANDASNSITSINENFNLLRQIFNRLSGQPVSDAYLQREKILRQRAGYADSTGHIQFSVQGLDMDWKSIFQKQQESNGKDMTSLMPDTYNANQLNNYLIRLKNESAYQYGDPSVAKKIEDQVQYLNGYFDSSMDRQNLVDAQPIEYDVTSLTYKFPNISKNIYTSINQIGRRGNSADYSIINSLGQACEIQCSNIPSKCRSTL